MEGEVIVLMEQAGQSRPQGQVMTHTWPGDKGRQVRRVIRLDRGRWKKSGNNRAPLPPVHFSRRPVLSQTESLIQAAGNQGRAAEVPADKLAQAD